MHGGFQVGPFQINYQQEEAAVSTGAGRRRRRRRYIVEVDGKEFEVESAQQALAILDRAREDARAAAAIAATEALNKIAPKALRVGKTRKLLLKAPEIIGSVELHADIKRANDAIRQIYLQAAMDAELQLLMLLQQQREEEETIIMLMSAD